MVSLYIDTSSDYLAAVLTDNNILKGSLSIYAGKNMSEILLVQIDNLLKSLSYNINDIDEFYADIGPGSFTGVRIGVAMVLGLSEGRGGKAYGISSLDIKAAASGEARVKAAAQLKNNIYAVKSYDFQENIFSDYSCEEIDDKDIHKYMLVNSGADTEPDMIGAVKSGMLPKFRTICSPVYLRKSEAEINIDKKSRS